MPVSDPVGVWRGCDISSSDRIPSVTSIVAFLLPNLFLTHIAQIKRTEIMDVIRIGIHTFALQRKCNFLHRKVGGVSFAVTLIVDSYRQRG